MKIMKIKAFLLIMLIFGYLSACAQINPVGSAHIDHDNHNALAKHHEDIAKEMQARLQEHKKLLQDYEDHSYYYGRKGQDIKSHASANIRYYEESLKENLKEAALHRKMAKEQEERNYTDTGKRNSGSVNENPVKAKATKDLKKSI